MARLIVDVSEAQKEAIVSESKKQKKTIKRLVLDCLKLGGVKV